MRTVSFSIGVIFMCLCGFKDNIFRPIFDLHPAIAAARCGRCGRRWRVSEVFDADLFQKFGSQQAGDLLDDIAAEFEFDG